MEFKVEHPNFVENEITWEISGLKSTLKYKGNPVKLKWGKTKLLDDYGIEREVKISDNFFNSPMIVIDKTEKIKVMENYSKIAYFFIIPSFLFLIKGGALVAVFLLLSIVYMLFSSLSVFSILITGLIIVVTALGSYLYILMPILKFKRTTKYHEEYTLVFSKESIKFKTQSIESEMKWDIYSALWDSHDFYYLIQAPRIYTLIPKRV